MSTDSTTPPKEQFLCLITANQAENLLDFFGGEATTYELIRLEAGAVEEDEPSVISPAGLYIRDTNCPEEGVIYLGEEDEEARPERLLVDEEHVIHLTPAEVQSKHDRVKWAEGLIRQLPETHDGRNSWLLNFGEKMIVD